MSAQSMFRSGPETPAIHPRTAPQPVLLEEAVSSQELLNGRREILISHGDRVYRLRHTSNDKLILTK